MTRAQPSTPEIVFILPYRSTCGNLFGDSVKLGQRTAVAKGSELANSYTVDLTNPEFAEAGSRSTAALFAGYGNAINLAHARGGNATVISQSYPDDLAFVRNHFAAILASQMAEPALHWRVPIVDNARALEMSWIVGGRETPFDSTKTVEIVIESSADSKTLVIDAEQVTEYTATIDVDTAADFDDLTVTFNCDAGASFRIHTITAWYPALSSPVATGYVKQPDDGDGITRRFAAIGATQMGTGKPISSAIGKNLIDACHALDRRIETGIVWSAFNFLSNADTSAGYGDQWYDEPTPVLIRGRAGGQSKYVFHVQASNPTHTDVDIVLCVTGGEYIDDHWPSGHNVVGHHEYTFTLTVPALAARVYLTHTTNFLRFATPVGLNNPDRAVQAGILSQHVAQGRSDGDNETTLGPMGNPPAGDALGGRPRINALSIWAKP